MKQRGMATAVIVVIAVVVVVIGVVAAAAVFMLAPGLGGPAEGEKEGGEEVGGIAAATSIDMKIDRTYPTTGGTDSIRYRVKNLNLADWSNTKLREDGTYEDGQVCGVIEDAAAGKVYIYDFVTGQWEDRSEAMHGLIIQDFYVDWGWYMNHQLSGWTSGEWTFTDPITGTFVRIYDIVLNPELPDSLFLPG